MQVRPLRDLKRNTELLILIELLETPSARLKDIASRLDVTVQAVSQYMAAMKREGLLKGQGGKVRPTRKGMQLLQEHFTALKHEVDATLRRISYIDSCVAVAGADVNKGQSVGLVMEDGMLMAYPDRRESSMGTALERATEGDDLLVGNLEGIVDLELGQLLIIEAPSEHDGGSKGADVDCAAKAISGLSPGLLVAGDLVGASLLSKATEEYFSLHAPVEAAMSALSKGVDVVFCGTKDSSDLMVSAVNKLRSDSGYQIRWKTLKV